MVERFQDDGSWIGDFSDEVLVVCPRCSGMATLTAVKDKDGRTAEHRRVCTSCGSTHTFGQVADYSLWLVTECKGNTLMALNERHLDYMESYVKAELREGNRDGSAVYRNKTVASRLPAWIKSAKNRDDVLKCIKRLRERIG
ncbi:MAG: hypothetical protein HZA22_08210 [Nitrospirae bacterium]|nr:hypothetical protein [Nitrospirota bacterium]